ncbi:MAG: polysaccharide deacetylase family protein [Actinomycetota bacterium]|nr:polysaccharide deacetylase family protein [Actinomycetota bacterium]
MRRSNAPHHRRRRAAAVLVLAGLALVIGIVIGAGGSALHHPQARLAPPGFFARVRTLAGSGAGSFAVDEQRAENGAIDRTLSYTPWVRIAGSQHKEIALSFDDGPGPYTPAVLSALEREHVPGTFFEVGILERYFNASTTRIVADGYPIGDHTEAHAPMSHLSRRDQLSQLLKQTAVIGNYGAAFPRMFRPPYGLWNSNTLSLLHKYRMLMILWTVDTGDYRRPGVSAIVKSAVSGARPGAIILLHDAGGDRSETVAALPLIIKRLRAKGYRLVTIPRLLLDNPAPHDQDISAVIGSGG